MNRSTRLATRKISLLVADLDGILVTKEKVFIERVRNAVQKMQDAGIACTITSGRPPLGMKMVIDAMEFWFQPTCLRPPLSL